MIASRDLPNLEWLRVFAAAAAAQSFGPAATALGVTPGAVSQRVKALEGHLGVELFHRHPRGVRLTEAGEAFGRRIRPLLNELSAATRDLKVTDAQRSIRISVLPALAQLWLGKRMESFHQRLPGVTIELDADPAVIDLPNTAFDFAIRYGAPPFDGCRAIQLFDDALVPVAAPGLIARSQRDDLGLPVGATLLVDTYLTTDMDIWTHRAAGAARVCPSIQRFSLYAMVVEAALNGQGYMIGHTALIGDLLREGRLEPLSSIQVRSNKQLFLLKSASDTPPPAGAEVFEEWLLAEAGAAAPPDADGVLRESGWA